MRTAKVLAFAIVTGFSLSVAAAAAPGPKGPALPPGAVEIAPDVYSLGKRQHQGVEVEGIAFVHRARPHEARRPGGGGSCFSYISGAKWTVAEPWLVNETNAPITGMLGLMSTDVATWESTAQADILGDGTIDPTAHASTTLDGRNVAEFGNAGGGGTVAVTYVWFSSGGAPKSRVLHEWDMVFGSNWDWSTDAGATEFDFRNVDTHELGHAMGLDHPSNTCTAETMYAYVDFGETNKRDLNPGDVAGITGLY